MPSIANLGMRDERDEDSAAEVSLMMRRMITMIMIMISKRMKIRNVQEKDLQHNASEICLLDIPLLFCIHMYVHKLISRIEVEWMRDRDG